jgi:hypothetical protein
VDGKESTLTQWRSEDGAQAAQRRAENAGANSERNRQWLRELMPEAGTDEHGWGVPASAEDRDRDGTAQARDQAARMHENAATMHERAVNLGIGDSDEHRRSAARHRDAATSHRSPAPPTDAA